MLCTTSASASSSVYIRHRCSAVHTTVSVTARASIIDRKSSSSSNPINNRSDEKVEVDEEYKKKKKKKRIE